MSAVRYHLSPSTGNPNKCTAQPGRCPYGTEDKHFASKDEARKGFEASSGGSFNGEAKSEPSDQKLEALAAAHVQHKQWAWYPAKPTSAQLRAAAAHAQLNNSFVPVGYSDDYVSRMLDNQVEYDDTGGDYVPTQKRVYTIATPTGEFVRVSMEAGVSSNYDDYWEYSPRFEVAYQTFSSSRSLAGGRPEAKGRIDLFMEADEALRYTYPGGGSRPDYDHGSEGDTRKASLRLMDKLADPYSVARMARLLHSKKRIKPEALLATKTLESPRGYVRAALAARKELPREAQAALAVDKEKDVRHALAERSDLTAATVKTLLSQNDSWRDRGPFGPVRHAVLANPALSATVQKREATKGDLEDLKVLARNPALAPEARRVIEARTAGLGVRLLWGQGLRAR